MSPRPVQVGLVGAGPWASVFHAPILARSPHVCLSGVWARRAAAAETLAAEFATTAYVRYDELVEKSDVLVIAVAPEAQPDLARQAAAAGKPLLLEKPLARSFDEAAGLVDDLERAGVGNLVLLTSRFVSEVNAFLSSVDPTEAFGGRIVDVTGALLSGVFSDSPWRQAEGALLDIGPHAIDIAVGAFGKVAEVTAADDTSGSLVNLQLRHESGAISQVALSLRVPGSDRFIIDVYTPAGTRTCDVLDLTLRSREAGSLEDAITEAIAAIARGERPPYPDARAALGVQATIDEARSQLAHDVAADQPQVS